MFPNVMNADRESCLFDVTKHGPRRNNVGQKPEHPDTQGLLKLHRYLTLEYRLEVCVPPGLAYLSHSLPYNLII